LASYTAELSAHKLPDSIDRDSFAYVGDDSWLLDFEDRIERFCAAFPTTVIDYDDEVRRCGNVIPSLLRTLGVEGSFSAEDCSAYFLNRRASPISSRLSGA
jgi:hypothetical protein